MAKLKSKGNTSDSDYMEIRDLHTVEKRKICLVGEAAVGKTSLIRRFVKNEFSERYATTMGTNVSKKELTLTFPEKKIKVDVVMMIWDIMGQKTVRKLLKDAYFDGAQGIIAVCDMTRKKTLGDLRDWMDSIYNITGKIPVVFLANKLDLVDYAELTLADVEALAKDYGVSPCYLTSAKEGTNVEKAFEMIARMIVAPPLEEAVSMLDDMKE